MKTKYLEQMNSIRETNIGFHSRNSSKRLGPSRLHEAELLFVQLIDFIRYKLSTFLLM